MYRTPSASPVPVVVAAAQGVVIGLDPATGEELWRNTLSGGGYGPVEIVVRDDLVLASATGGALFALDYRSGRTLWRAETTGLHGPASALRLGDRVIVAKGGALDCFTLAGERVWSYSALPGGEVRLAAPGASH